MKPHSIPLTWEKSEDSANTFVLLDSHNEKQALKTHHPEFSMWTYTIFDGEHYNVNTSAEADLGIMLALTPYKMTN